MKGTSEQGIMNSGKKPHGAALDKFSARYGSFFSRPSVAEPALIPALTEKLPAPPSEMQQKPTLRKPEIPVPQDTPAPVAGSAPPDETDGAETPEETARIRARVKWTQGCRAAPDEIRMLNRRWPEAFPFRAACIRPLDKTVLPTVIDATGWHPVYARAVLHVWKAGGAYCRAILRHTTRVHIDGSPGENTVDEHARRMARKRLEFLRKRAARRAEQSQQTQADPAAPATQTRGESPSQAETSQARDKHHGAQDD